METRKRFLPITTQNFETRDADDQLVIEGYFAVFNSIYEISDIFSESISPGAFTETIAGGDIRALTDHNTTLVLGRTTAGTLTLSEDEHGLKGRILINPNDQDAVNLYNRVQRGDVTQASIGFFIESQTYETDENNRTHWTINKIKLFEVSVCTFPAYEETALDARRADFDVIKKRELDNWKTAIRARLKGDNDGIKSVDFTEKDR